MTSLLRAPRPEPEASLAARLAAAMPAAGRGRRLADLADGASGQRGPDGARKRRCRRCSAAAWAAFFACSQRSAAATPASGGCYEGHANALELVNRSRSRAVREHLALAAARGGPCSASGAPTRRRRAPLPPRSAIGFGSPARRSTAPGADGLDAALVLAKNDDEEGDRALLLVPVDESAAHRPERLGACSGCAPPSVHRVDLRRRLAVAGTRSSATERPTSQSHGSRAERCGSPPSRQASRAGWPRLPQPTSSRWSAGDAAPGGPPRRRRGGGGWARGRCSTAAAAAWDEGCAPGASPEAAERARRVRPSRPRSPPSARCSKPPTSPSAPSGSLR